MIKRFALISVITLAMLLPMAAAVATPVVEPIDDTKPNEQTESSTLNVGEQIEDATPDAVEQTDEPTAAVAQRLVFELIKGIKVYADKELEAVIALARENIQAKIDIDTKGMVPRDVRVSSYTNLGQHFESFDKLNIAVAEDIEAAFKQGVAKLPTQIDWFSGDISLDCRAELSWQLFAALYKVYGNELSTMLEKALIVEGEIDSSCNIKLILRLPDIDYITMGTKDEDRFTAKFTYYYLNTYYDEKGTEREYVYEPLNEDYVKSIHLPVIATLEKAIKPCWYGSRSKGTRRHMGTDIKGPGGSELYACTEGVVSFIGFDSIAGNYVVILDDFGFEYHYYHMCELTKAVKVGQRVEAGQLIGLMGRTGNSDANHLHLSIANPSKMHIDPYMVLTQAGYGK